MSTFDEFTRAYRERDRAALEWKAQGGQVVGCLGSDVPEEFLIAAGFLTVRVCGDPSASVEAADRYIERAFDPLVRSQFARIVVDGAYSYLDHLIVSHSSDALVRVFYYLREEGAGNALVLLVYNQARFKMGYDRAIFFFDQDGVLKEHQYSHRN